MIKFHQSLALTSHFESFWSIVHSGKNCNNVSKLPIIGLQLLMSPWIVRSRRNYKEGLLFCCASVSCLFVWIGWVTAFMLLDEEGQDHAWQDKTICCGLVATPTVLLLVIFVPKVLTVTQI